MKKYLQNLKNSILDKDDVFVELMLAWIAIMLIGILILGILGSIA